MEHEELCNILEGKYSNWTATMEMWSCIQALNIKPTKDGNQWCFLYGENIQEGICGFGDTMYAAARDFYHNICTQTHKKGE